MDFANERARGVICIGIPYPNKRDPELSEKFNYHNKYYSTKQISKGDDWYQGLAFRALNQALGRCIRHRKDWGSVILLDSRLVNQRYTALLPKWIRQFIGAQPSFSESVTSLEQFFNQIQEMEEKERLLAEEQAVKEETATEEETIDLGTKEEASEEKENSLPKKEWVCSSCSNPIGSSTKMTLTEMPDLAILHRFAGPDICKIGATPKLIGTSLLANQTVAGLKFATFGCSKCKEMVLIRFSKLSKEWEHLGNEYYMIPDNVHVVE